MDAQLLLTWMAIGLAGTFLLLRGRRTWRALRGGASCGGGCGCPKESQAEPTLIAPEQLTMRQRAK